MQAFRKFMRLLSLAFAAGCFATAVTALILWFIGSHGLNVHLGTRYNPTLTMSWFSSKVFLGGLWGCLFTLPIIKKSIFLSALVYSIGPMITELFVVLPGAGHGVMGLSEGGATPILFIALSLTWAILAASWLLFVGGNK